MRDTTRQIGRSKLSRPIYDELKQLKCPVDRLNLLCCNAASTKQAGALTPRLLLQMYMRILLYFYFYHGYYCSLKLSQLTFNKKGRLVLVIFYYAYSKDNQSKCAHTVLPKLEIDQYGFFYSRCLEVRVSRWPICAADFFGRFLWPISLNFPLHLHAKIPH